MFVRIDGLDGRGQPVVTGSSPSPPLSNFASLPFLLMMVDCFRTFAQPSMQLDRAPAGPARISCLRGAQRAVG